MPIPIASVEQMRQWEEASWRAGRTAADVIAKVGQLAAAHALELTRPGERILILAGKGNNGKDALACEPHLPGRMVHAITVMDAAQAGSAVHRALKTKPHLIIDGLFGIGLSRPLDVGWIDLIDMVNRADATILSIDIPSGLNAETGEHMGAAVEADVTLAVGAPKLGLLQRSGYRYVGRLETLDNVGLLPLAGTRAGDEGGPDSFEIASRYRWTIASDFQSFPPKRRVDSHKGSLGHAVIIAGSLGYHGAAILAAEGAVRGRPGLVSLFTPENVYGPIAAQLDTVMVHPWYLTKEVPSTCTALLIGPGLAAPGTADVMRDMTNRYWQNLPLPVIVDASALDWLRPGPTPLSSRRIITPHPGEAARMLETKVETIQQNRFLAVKELSSRFGNCWVALKGHQTLVGRGSGEVYVNPSGNPDLAQGGAGDVLAGFLTGLLAQPRLQSDPLKAIRFAVWKHGVTADELTATDPGWGIRELVGRLRTRQPREV